MVLVPRLLSSNHPAMFAEAAGTFFFFFTIGPPELLLEGTDVRNSVVH